MAHVVGHFLRHVGRKIRVSGHVTSTVSIHPDLGGEPREYQCDTRVDAGRLARRRRAESFPPT